MTLSSPPKLAVLGSLLFALAGAIFAVGGLASLQASELQNSGAGRAQTAAVLAGAACQHGPFSRLPTLCHLQTPLSKWSRSSSRIITAG